MNENIGAGFYANDVAVVTNVKPADTWDMDGPRDEYDVEFRVRYTVPGDEVQKLRGPLPTVKRDAIAASLRRMLADYLPLVCGTVQPSEVMPKLKLVA
jgi:hypothetical protein